MSSMMDESQVPMTEYEQIKFKMNQTTDERFPLFNLGVLTEMPQKSRHPVCGYDEVQLDDGTIRPMTEVELLQRKIDETTSDSLEASRRMMALCEEAKEAGISTLVMLDDQGEQLDRINEGMDQINQDMKDAEKNLDDLNKCCGLCVLPWNKVKKKDDYTKQLKDEDMRGGDGPRIIVDQNGMGPTGGYITRITNDAREDEMDQNLQEVSGMIGNLRNMAIDMGSEINQQNVQVERIQIKAKSNAERIKKANEQASKLLK